MIRRSLTQKERATMWAHQQGRCIGCGESFQPKDMIAEHWTPVALGNSKKPDCLLCKPCADRKTRGTKATTKGSDIHSIARAKRLAKGGKTRRGPKLRSAGFKKPPEGYQHQWPKRKVGQ